MTKMRPGRLGSRRRRGFSLIELLVAIIIIGILVTVLVPVISNRTEQARQTAAQADLKELATMMERTAIDTGFYVRLFALDDQLRGDDIPFDREQNDDRVDGLRDYLTAVPQPYIQFPTANSLFINPDTGDFANTSRDNIIERLSAAETRYTGQIQWGGPYMNWHRDENFIDNLLAPDDIPDDPWGNNYLFFTSEGLIVEPDGVIAINVTLDDEGVISPGGTWEADIFDRPAMLSLGPNGVPGNGLPASEEGEFGQGDDFTFEFGK